MRYLLISIVQQFPNIVYWLHVSNSCKSIVNDGTYYNRLFIAYKSKFSNN